MRRLSLVFLLLSATGWAQSPAYSTKNVQPPWYTVGTLPTQSANQHILYGVYDGTTGTDCTVGGGSSLVLCAWTGSAWSSVGGSSSGGTLQPSGTPTAGQIALWVNSTTLQGVSTLPSLSLAGTGAGILSLTQGADNSANCPVNSECRQANSGIATKFTVTGPAAAATGFRYGVNSAGLITESIGELAGDCTTSASLTITCTKTNSVAFSSFATLSSTFSAHQFLGNNTSGSATAGASLIGTSDVSPNLYVADSGAVNVYVATLSPAMTAYSTGVMGCFKASASNTTATPTINFNGLGAKTIVKFNNGALSNGDINITEPSCVIYDGANFLLLNPQLTSGTGGIARVSSPSFTNIGMSGTVTSYNNISTAGQGVSWIIGATSQKAETTTADANVLTVTPAAAVGTYRACVVVSVSAATSGVISWTLSWTDSNGAAQANIAQDLFQQGTAAPNTTFTTSAAGNYNGCSIFDINNAAAAIVVKWVGGGTTTAKMSALIERLF